MRNEARCIIGHAAGSTCKVAILVGYFSFPMPLMRTGRQVVSCARKSALPPASGPGPSPVGFKGLTSPHPPPCAQPTGLSPVSPASPPRWGEQRQEPWTLKGASVRTVLTAQSLLQSALQCPKGFVAPAAAMGGGTASSGSQSAVPLLFRPKRIDFPRSPFTPRSS